MEKTKLERSYSIVSDFTGETMYELGSDCTFEEALSTFYDKFEEELTDLVECYGTDDPVCEDLHKLMYLVVTYPNGFEKKVYYEGGLTAKDCLEQ